MKNLDMKKLSVIIELTNEHLKKNETYRFACNLNTSELSFLESNFNLKEIENNSPMKLWLISKK